jgi:hypothetical protein
MELKLKLYAVYIYTKYRGMEVSNEVSVPYTSVFKTFSPQPRIRRMFWTAI